MSTVIFTASSLRYKVFASIINNNPNIDLLKVFHEEGLQSNEVFIFKKIIYHSHKFKPINPQ